MTFTTKYPAQFKPESNIFVVTIDIQKINPQIKQNPI